MMVSYAQDVEDVMLQRAFPRDYRGFYIDAGASDPVQFSVTKHFYDRGWAGSTSSPCPRSGDGCATSGPATST